MLCTDKFAQANNEPQYVRHPTTRAALERLRGDRISFAPEAVSPSKIKKTGAEMVLRLRPTPDILAALGRAKRPGQVLVGFALETDDGPANARRKLETKNLDWIVLNNPKEPGAGFGPGTNRVTLLARDGTVEDLPRMPKRAVAEAILDRVAAAFCPPTAG